MSKSSQFVVINTKSIYCRYDREEIETFSADMLSAKFWQDSNSITGSAQGRGTTWFVKQIDETNNNEKHWVLRHYFRGGLIGKIITDSYFFTSQENTRAAKEFALLAHMQTLQLPAPKPIAYRVSRHGLFYRADLLSSRIENAQDLVAILTKKSIDEATWYAIGETIKTFHNHGIYHHDLNAHNILLDDKNKHWLIDFDQGEIKTLQKGWQQNNLQRLLRSFHKEQSQLPIFNWNVDNWNTLLNGYNS